MRRARMKRVAAALTVVAFLCGASLAFSHTNGKTGASGKDGANCNSCHSGGPTPGVSFEGALKVDAGSVVTYRFIVKPNIVVDAGDAGDGGDGGLDGGIYVYGAAGAGIAASDDVTLLAVPEGGVVQNGTELT